MKKKFLLFLFIFTLLFTITACGSSNDEGGKGKGDDQRESKKNQTGFVEGKYSIKNLTFNLPDVYKEEDENVYSYIGDGNGIRVMLYVTENYEGTLDEFMNKDKDKLYPSLKTMNDTEIHGNHWLKGKSTDNDTLYYIKDGKDIYVIDLAPMFTTASVFNQLVTTLENSLYFK